MASEPVNRYLPGLGITYKVLIRADQYRPCFDADPRGSDSLFLFLARQELCESNLLRREGAYLVLYARYPALPGDAALYPVILPMLDKIV